MFQKFENENLNEKRLVVKAIGSNPKKIPYIWTILYFIRSFSTVGGAYET